MSVESENVRRFRETVEIVVEQNQSPRYGKLVRPVNATNLGDLSYVSVDRHQGRPIVVGLGSEHDWAIIQRHVRIGRYSGSLAIVSSAEEGAALFRKWYLRSPFPSIGIPSSRKIEDPTEIEMAVQWAQSPHVHAGVLDALGVLIDTEGEHIATRYAELSDNATKLRHHLDAMADARAQAEINAHYAYVR